MIARMEGFAHVNGVRLWHRLTGDGEPVVRFHGAGFGHFTFDPVTPELSRRFRVIDFDLRGYGASGRPEQHHSTSFDSSGKHDRVGDFFARH